MRHAIISQTGKGLPFTDTKTCSVNSNFGVEMWMLIICSTSLHWCFLGKSLALLGLPDPLPEPYYQSRHFRKNQTITWLLNTRGPLSRGETQVIVWFQSTHCNQPSWKGLPFTDNDKSDQWVQYWCGDLPAYTLLYITPLISSRAVPPLSGAPLSA